MSGSSSGAIGFLAIGVGAIGNSTPSSTLSASIIITPILNMAASAPFHVLGTYQLSESTWVDTLVYEDDHGTNVPIASPPVQLTQSSWSLTHAALPPGTHTVSIKDPLTGTVAVSNQFTVGVAQVVAADTPTGVVAGTPFTFTGTLTNFTSAPALTYSLNGGPPVSLGGVTNTGWSTQLTIATAGSYTIIVSSGSLSSKIVTFIVAPATVNHTITPAPLNGGAVVTAGANISFTGSLTGYATAPSLTYTINNSQPVQMTGVTATGWSMTITAPATAGTYVINVSDGTTQASQNFSVSPAAKVITPTAPSGAVAGQSFTFTGSLSGYTTIPALTYALNSGIPVSMTGVSVSGWAMTITIPTAGNYTVVVADGTGVSGSASFAVASPPPPTATRNWYQNPGMDGSFWVQPFYSSAQWITSGSLVTALRNGSHASPTGTVNLKDNFSTPYVIGTASDPIVTVTDKTNTIHVHMPVGTIIETPNSAVDNSIGGADATQPYLIWSISGATMSPSPSVAGSVITGTYGMAVMDGSGLMMVDAVTGQPGDGNAIGNIMDYELGLLNADPNFVIPHMLAFQLDQSTQCSGQGPVWPLKLVDLSGPNTGPIPQGITIGIPASVKRPVGQTRGFYAWFDVLQQYGAFEYNDGATTAVNFSIYSTNSANASLVTDMVNSLSAVMAYVCILNYTLDGVNTPLGTNLSGAQYSLATTKGFVPGATPAFPGPPPLDLSPTGGVNVAPSTFGAWYPSGYNAIPTNSTTTATHTISPSTPTNAVVNTAFTFSGSLGGYASAPSLTYSLDGGTATALGGVTSTGWSTNLTIPTSGTHTIVVNDAANNVSGSVSFNVSSGAVTSTPVTWNSSSVAGGITISSDKYTATANGTSTPNSAPQGVRGTTAIDATKIVLFEVAFSAITQNCAVGLANASAVLNSTGGLGVDANSIGFYASTGPASQPAQTVYENSSQLTAGNGVTSVAGEVVTVVTNGSSAFFSDSAMRSTSGVAFNNSTTANPVTNSGGFSFSSVGATYYPAFATGEGGGIVVLNDGTKPLSAFATAFLNANPSVVTLSGQVTQPGNAINPATPVGVIAGQAFSFTGSLSGYASTPSLTYSINGGTSSPLAGVSKTGWSTTLTIATTGTDTITVSDGTVSGSTGSFTVSATGGATPTVSVSLTSTTGQTVPSTIYGLGTGAFATNGFANTGVSALASASSSLVPALFRVNMNASANGQNWQDAIFATGGPFWQYFDPMIANAGGANSPQALPVLVSHTFVSALATATTPAINTTTSDLLVVIQSQYSQSTVATVSDSNSNTWNFLAAASGISAYVRIGYVFNPIVGASHTFTKTAAGNDFGTLLVLAFTGAGTYSGITNSAAGGSAGTSLSSGTVTPAGDGSLIVSGACITDGSSTPYNVNSGMTVSDRSGWVTGQYEGGAAAFFVQGSKAAITPTWSWTGSATAAAATAVFGLSNSGGGSTPQAPPQAAAAGFTHLIFNDDFTSNTVLANSGSANTPTNGINWYWKQATSTSNASVNTSLMASAVNNGNTGGGSFASASGGILTLNGVAGNGGNVGLVQSVPPNLTNGTQPPGAWLHGYFECYMQFQATNNSPSGWVAFWCWALNGLFGELYGPGVPHMEVDIAEYYPTASAAKMTSNVHQWSATESSQGQSNFSDTLTQDSQWHLYGCLWTGNGTTGTLSFYRDNGASPYATLNIGSGTTYTSGESSKLYFALSAGQGWPVNIDYVRVWQ